MKTYVTFGQSHAHAINGKTFDKDCVAVIHHAKEEDGRELAFELFGSKFCFEYPSAYWHFDLTYFPRGYINANDPSNGSEDTIIDVLEDEIEEMIEEIIEDIELDSDIEPDQELDFDEE